MKLYLLMENDHADTRALGVWSTRRAAEEFANEVGLGNYVYEVTVDEPDGPPWGVDYTRGSAVPATSPASPPTPHH